MNIAAAAAGASKADIYLLVGRRKCETNEPQAKDFVVANPKLIAGGASVAAATVSFACPMLVAVPVLGALGFGAAGPVAGTNISTSYSLRLR